MDIEYTQTTRKRQEVEVDGLRYYVPRLAFACTRTQDVDTYEFNDPAPGIKTVQSKLMDIINTPELDDATKLTVYFEGDSFHTSIQFVEGIVFGRYSFIAQFPNKPVQIAYQYLLEHVVFVHPADILDELQLAEG